MTGVEIDLVVHDSVKAMSFYQKVFRAERLEVTNFERGLNEAVFVLFETRFHLLDESPEYGLVAPLPEEDKPFWVNLMVEDLDRILETALENGATLIQPITPIPEIGVKNASFMDPYGHVWLLHQLLDETISDDPEARMAFLEEKFGRKS